MWFPPQITPIKFVGSYWNRSINRSRAESRSFVDEVNRLNIIHWLFIFSTCQQFNCVVMWRSSIVEKRERCIVDGNTCEIIVSEADRTAKLMREHSSGCGLFSAVFFIHRFFRLVTMCCTQYWDGRPLSWLRKGRRQSKDWFAVNATLSILSAYSVLCFFSTVPRHAEKNFAVRLLQWPRNPRQA